MRRDREAEQLGVAGAPAAACGANMRTDRQCLFLLCWLDYWITIDDHARHMTSERADGHPGRAARLARTATVVISEAARGSGAFDSTLWTLLPSFPHMRDVARGWEDRGRGRARRHLAGRLARHALERGPGGRHFHLTLLSLVCSVASNLTSVPAPRTRWRSTPTPGSGDYAPCLCLWLACRPRLFWEVMSRCVWLAVAVCASHLPPPSPARC